MALGNDAMAAYGRDIANAENIKTIKIGCRLDCYLHGLKTRVFDKTGFGSYHATKKFIKQIKEYNPDIIHLHNIHGYYLNVELLFEYLKVSGKKILWTLHDCWAFTGHCTYFDYANCSKWKTACSDCLQKNEYPSSLFIDNSKQNFIRKKQAFCKVPNLTILTPSKWLADLVGESFLSAYPVQVINNKIDTEVFKPTPSEFRKKHNLQQKKIVLGVASVWEKRKGLDDFIKLADMLDDTFKIVLVGISEKQKNNLHKNILGLPRTNSAYELAQIYTASDVYLSLSYEDNYPTVILEAQACKTKVIAYDVGGCKEMVEDNNLIAAGDLRHVTQLLEKIIDIKQ